MAEPVRRRALFVTPEAPYPMVGGGALRAASLLEYLARSHSVDAIVFRAPDAGIDFPSGLIDRLLAINLPRHSKHRSLIAAFLKERPPYDLAVVEHFWCAPYWEQIGARCRRTILDLHNIESAWHLGCGRASDWPHSLAHGVFHRAALDLERQWLPRYSLLLAASAPDAQRVSSIAPQARVAIYPNTIPLIDLPAREEQDNIVFSGTLEYEPNRTAVRYFSSQIWPVLERMWPNLKWRLVGRAPEAVARYIRGCPRIECTGAVDDAIAHLATAKVAVVPLLSGSGTRLKIIEAWAAGTPVVSTSLGAEGLPALDGQNMLLADGSESFTRAVSRLLEFAGERERIGRAGRAQYEREFTWDAAWGALDRDLGPIFNT